jgi:outer membrane protein TolC
MHSRHVSPGTARSRGRSAGTLRAGLAALAAAGWAGPGGGGGCQSYERRPLDLEGHRAAFLARTPDACQAAALAEQLAAPPPEAPPFDPTDGLTCAEAEAIALVFNADLRLARLRAGVTRAAAEHAGLWEDPTIGVDLVRIIQGTPEPWKLFTSVGLTLPLSGRLEAEKQRAGLEHAAELARVAQREWSVRMSVRRAWSEWTALDHQAAATRQFLDRVEQVLAVVDAMERAGEMGRTEARLFRIEKATAAAELAALESRALEASLRLNQLMGVSPDAPLQPQAAGLAPAAGARGGSLRADDDADRVLRAPAMLVAAAEYEAAEKAVELEVRRQFPDLHLGPGYGREDGQDQVLLGLSVPIPLLNANRRAIAEALARRELARAAAETTLEQSIATLRAAEVRLAATSRRRAALESEVVPLVDAQYEDARRVARLGEVNTLVLLESLKRQQEAKVALIEAARDQAIAAVDVDEVLGPPPTPSSPPPAPPPAPPTGALPADSAQPGLDRRCDPQPLTPPTTSGSTPPNDHARTP